MDTEEKINIVYYHPVNNIGEEMEESIAISLKENGEADVSLLPQDLRDTFSHMGVPDELHLGTVFPKDGEQFLRGLLAVTNGYIRFHLYP